MSRSPLSGGNNLPPIDPSDPDLEPETKDLIDRLARHTYQPGGAGASGRAKAPKAPKAPQPLPYDQLDPATRGRARQDAARVITTVRDVGYQIQPQGGPPDAFVATVLGMAKIGELTSAQFVSLWQSWDRDRRYGEPGVYAGLGQRALALGESLMALGMIRAGLRFYPWHTKLRQLEALALARRGEHADARDQLLALARGGARDAETVGLLAGAFKSLWELAPEQDPGTPDSNLTAAYRYYDWAYRNHPPAGPREERVWVGINVATLAACRGDWDRAKSVAANVEAECAAELKEKRLRRFRTDDIQNKQADTHDDYWLLATMGEAALVRDMKKNAGVWYQRAHEVAAGAHGHIQATRRNARLLLRRAMCLTADVVRQKLDEWLPLPRVVLFAGHRVDAPGRPARFPAGQMGDVHAAIRQQVKDLNAGISYSMAAAGADILFLEAMLWDAGPTAEVNVVLPFDLEEFIADSVRNGGAGGFTDPGATATAAAGAGGPADPFNWERRLRAVLTDPRVRVSQVSASRVGKARGGGVAYDYTNQVIYGVAKLRAEHMGMELAPLAVWDGEAGGYGGTASIVTRWLKDEPAVRRIHPARPSFGVEVIGSREAPIAAGVSPASVKAASTADAAAAHTPTEAGDENAKDLMALLFADVAGFSKLPDKDLPLFREHFLIPVARMAKDCPTLRLQNTWGDALQFVFESVEEAGLFALRLRDFVRDGKWVTEKGLSQNLRIRIAVHAGPVYQVENPVTEQNDYIGTHLSRAARLEPITPENQVYASQGFAALACIGKFRGFECEYVGEEVMPKKYGKFPTYRVDRKPTAPDPDATAAKAAGCGD